MNNSAPFDPVDLIQSRGLLVHREMLLVRDQLAAASSNRCGHAVRRWHRHLARLRAELDQLAVQRRAWNGDERRVSRRRVKAVRR